MAEETATQTAEETAAPAKEAEAQLDSAKEKPGVSAAPRRDRSFYRGLLEKLPTLTATSWHASDTLDVFQGIQGVVDLDSDAFLEPLEKLAETTHGG